MLNREIAAISYRVEMPADDFNALEEYEDDLPTVTGCLFDILDKRTCARNIEYSGHFGSNIFFTLEVADTTDEELEAIEQIITEQIAIAKHWEKNRG